METTTYRRVPFTVKAVRVTEENMAEVAEWCEGSVRKAVEGAMGARIRVPVTNAKSSRQTHAFVGDWVLSGSMGFKVYSDRAFQKGFEETADDAPEETADFDGDTTQPELDIPEEELPVSAEIH
jgi:hypothetical protein